MSQPLREDTIKKVEELTRGQQDNPVWHDLKKGVVTASCFLNVIKVMQYGSDSIETAMYEDPLDKVMGMPLFDTPAMQWGREHKEEGLLKYWEENCAHLHQTHELRRPGLYLSRQNPLVGASPVAIVYAKNDPTKPLFIVQVKCPYSKRAADPREAARKLGNVKANGEFYLKRHHDFSYQIQALMGVTGIHHCAMVVYTMQGIYVGQAEFDKEFFDRIMNQVAYFTRTKLYPKLLE